MKTEDILLLIEKVNDGFEGYSLNQVTVGNEGRASVELRINDDLYQINLTQGHFNDK